MNFFFLTRKCHNLRIPTNLCAVRIRHRTQTATRRLEHNLSKAIISFPLQDDYKTREGTKNWITKLESNTKPSHTMGADQIMNHMGGPRWGGQGIWTPLKKTHKNKGVLSSIGPVPIKNHKLQSQHSTLGHHQHASEMPF